MATNATTPLNDPSQERNWRIFAVKGYARIVARKHGIAAPLLDDDSLLSLSDEELDNRWQLLRDLAHLPPG